MQPAAAVISGPEPLVAQIFTSKLKMPSLPPECLTFLFSGAVERHKTEERKGSLRSHVSEPVLLDQWSFQEITNGHTKCRLTRQ